MILPSSLRTFFTLLLVTICITGAFAQNVQVGKQQSSDFDLAKQYFENQEYEKALDFLKELLRESKNQQVYQMAFESYLELEDYRAAEKLAESWINRLPGQQQDFQADLFFLYLKQGKERKAERLQREIEESIAQQPGRAYAYAKVFQQRGYPQRALAFYQAALEARPGMNFDYQMAQLYGEMGEMKRMYELYVNMVERNPGYLPTVKILVSRSMEQGGLNSEAGEHFKQKLIEKIQNGGSHRLNELLVHIFVQEKDFKGAFVQLRALDRRGVINSDELYRLAQVAQNNQEYALAQQVYGHLMDKGRENPYYISSVLGNLESRKEALENSAGQSKDWGQLIRDYEKSRSEFRSEPKKAAFYIDMAEIYAYRLNDTDTAEALLHDILKTGFVAKSDQALAQIALADLLLYTGNRWDAILYYRRAEKEFEQSPIGQEAKFKRAKAAYYVGDFEWAKGIFDVLKASTSKLIANDAMRYSLLIKDNMDLDTNSDVLEAYSRADLQYFQGRLDSALFMLNILDDAYSEHPIHDEVLYRKGEIFYRQGDYASAEAAWLEVAELHREDILADDALYRLARLYEELNKAEKAMQQYEIIFVRYRDSFYAAEARQRYRELRGDTVN